MVRVRVKIRGERGTVIRVATGYCHNRNAHLAVVPESFAGDAWEVMHRKSGFGVGAHRIRTAKDAIKLAATLEPLAQWDEIYKAILK